MQDIYAELISIGDEILYGQTLDTNSHYISAELDKLGIRVKRKVTVADDREAMMRAFKEAEANADIIIITGGLGPTKDDLTKPLLAEYFDSDMILHEDILEDLRKRFAKRGRELNELNKGQAELPKNVNRLKINMEQLQACGLKRQIKFLFQCRVFQRK